MICLTTEQFSPLSQFILNELWSRDDGSVSGSRSHVASSLHDRALTCIYGCYGELCSQPMISGSVGVNAVLTEGPKTTGNEY